MCNILGMSGLLCTVSLPPDASLRELQEAIEEKTGTARWSQRLVIAVQDVRSDNDLDRMCRGAKVIDLTMVQRPDQQARWLQQLEEAPTVERWLMSAGAGPRSDREVILKAVAQCGDALRFAAKEVRADREVALAAVRQDWRALEHVDPELWFDRALALAAVAQNGMALGQVAPELRADYEVAFAAVTQSGLALEHAAADLQADRGVVLAAVTQDGRALRFAAPDLRADKKVASTAVAQHQKVLQSNVGSSGPGGPWWSRTSRDSGIELRSVRRCD